MNLFESYALNKASKILKKGRNEKILKVFSFFATEVTEYGLYRNVIRVLALYSTGNESAKVEYGTMLNQKQLELLSAADQEYINLLIYKFAHDNHSNLEYKYHTDEVSKRTLDYFHEL